jgi:hypothetical protein
MNDAAKASKTAAEAFRKAQKAAEGAKTAQRMAQVLQTAAGEAVLKAYGELKRAGFMEEPLDMLYRGWEEEGTRRTSMIQVKQELIDSGERESDPGFMERATWRYYRNKGDHKTRREVMRAKADELREAKKDKLTESSDEFTDSDEQQLAALEEREKGAQQQNKGEVKRGSERTPISSAAEAKVVKKSAKNDPPSSSKVRLKEKAKKDEPTMKPRTPPLNASFDDEDSSSDAFQPKPEVHYYEKTYGDTAKLELLKE